MKPKTEAIRAAAFFDVDGTLFAGPSLEMRFFRFLRRNKKIPLPNCLLWMLEALRLAPKGLQLMIHANKAHLRGVRGCEDLLASWQSEFTGAAMLREAVERAAWHVRQGHRLVLVTGTLEPLALRAASLLKAALRQLGCEVPVHVCATQLETKTVLGLDELQVKRSSAKQRRKWSVALQSLGAWTWRNAPPTVTPRTTAGCSKAWEGRTP